MALLFPLCVGEISFQAAAEEESNTVDSWRSLHPEIDYWTMVFNEAYQGAITSIEETDEGTIVATLRGGEKIPVQDFLSDRNFEDRINAPDLLDIVWDPYPSTLDLPRWPVNFDPGRYRNDLLLKATYGHTEETVKENLVPIEFVGKKVYFNKQNGCAEALKRVGIQLQNLVEKNQELRPYIEELGGGFSWRKISGTERMSSHSFAIAIDLNPKFGGYWRWNKDADLSAMKRRLAYPPAIVEAFEKEKFIWGGKWYHFDLMHFEYRPEFFG